MSLPTDGTSVRINVQREVQEAYRMEAEYARTHQQPTPQQAAPVDHHTRHTGHHSRHHNSRRRADHRVALTAGEQQVVDAVHADAAVHDQNAPGYTPYKVIADLQAKGADVGRFNPHGRPITIKPT